MSPPKLPEDLRELLRHLEAAYPSEGCGLILEGPEGFRVRPMTNAYDRYHAVDPEQFPRTSRTAYMFDPKEHLAVQREAEARGERVHCVVHSHADVGAYFSDEDRAMAAPEGQPLLPGVCYLVVAVDAGKTTGAKLFLWASGEFQEFPVRLPGLASAVL